MEDKELLGEIASYLDELDDYASLMRLSSVEMFDEDTQEGRANSLLSRAYDALKSKK